LLGVRRRLVPVASTTTAAAAITTAAAAAAAAAASRTRPGFVHPQVAPLHIDAIQGLYRCVSISVVCHLDKAESARPTRFTIDDHSSPLNLSVLLE